MCNVPTDDGMHCLKQRPFKSQNGEESVIEGHCVFGALSFHVVDEVGHLNHEAGQSLSLIIEEVRVRIVGIGVGPEILRTISGPGNHA